MGDLLPCPFCGSSNIGHTGRKTLAHSCADCEARGPTTEGALENEDTWGRAEIAWNTRAIPSATQAGGENQALRAMIRVNMLRYGPADLTHEDIDRQIEAAIAAFAPPSPPAPEGEG